MSLESAASELERLRLENETLSGVVGVVASGPDLVHILDRVVDLLTKATDSHACFIYLPVEGRLVLRAASPIFSHLVGQISFGVDEGLAGWVMRERRPAFLKEDSLDDDRTVYVPELEEERFQSMVAVPIAARSGASIGAIVIHTVAPREFNEGILNVLSRAASLVSGAIENARLYEEAQERVAELTRLSTLGREIAAVAERGELFQTAVRGMRALIGADACMIYEHDSDGVLRRVADDPAGEGAGIVSQEEERAISNLLAGSSSPSDSTALGLKEGSSAIAVPLAYGDERQSAILVIGRATWANPGQDLVRAAAHQLGLALENIDLIERLTGENAARDLFDALASDEPEIASGRAAAARIDLDASHVVVVARGVSVVSKALREESADALERAIQKVNRGFAAYFSANSLQLLLPVHGQGIEPAQRIAGALHHVAAAQDLAIGVGEARSGAIGAQRGLQEATDAARIGVGVLHKGAVVLYRYTGAYRYLIGLLDSGGPVDYLMEVADRLAGYDRDRKSQLLCTLDVYLDEGRSIAAAARELWIHSNTLRQRLERIESLTDISLADEDLLALHLAVKLARARHGDDINLAGPAGIT